MNDKDAEFKRKLTSVHTKIISEEEVTNVRNKFYEDIDFLFEEAIQRHRNSGTGDIPWWIWALLAWFASDNVMNWIASPILFYPLLMLGMICAVLHSMGVLSILLDLAFPIVKSTVNNL